MNKRSLYHNYNYTFFLSDPDGALRIENGLLEISSNNQFRPVCGAGNFSLAEADVICRQFGKGHGNLPQLPFVSDFTVQTFNSCTSRPDVCQRLHEQTPTGNMSIEMSIKTQKHSNDPSSLRIKVMFICRSLMHPSPGNWLANG